MKFPTVIRRSRPLPPDIKERAAKWKAQYAASEIVGEGYNARHLAFLRWLVHTERLEP